MINVSYQLIFTVVKKRKSSLSPEFTHPPQLTSLSTKNKENRTKTNKPKKFYETLKKGSEMNMFIKVCLSGFFLVGVVVRISVKKGVKTFPFPFRGVDLIFSPFKRKKRSFY